MKRTGIAPESHLQANTFRRKLIDQFIRFGFLCSGLLVTAILLLIFGFLISKSWPALIEIGPMEFLTGQRWMPSSPRGAGYGALPMILSSIVVTVAALIIAVPWGVGAAIFINEIAPTKLKELLKPFIEMLAIFPSVVLGFFGLVALGPFIANLFGLSSGLNGLTGAIVLAVMSLPTIVSISEDALNSVPNAYREASYGLGANRWETIARVSLPSASSGIIAGVMLGFGRAVGETMAILMAAGNALNMPITEILGMPVPTLMKSVRTLTANIAIEGSDVAWGSLHYHSLFVLALILFVITFAVNLVADIMHNRFHKLNRAR